MRLRLVRRFFSDLNPKICSAVGGGGETEEVSAWSTFVSSISLLIHLCFYDFIKLLRRYLSSVSEWYQPLEQKIWSSSFFYRNWWMRKSMKGRRAEEELPELVSSLLRHCNGFLDGRKDYKTLAFVFYFYRAGKKVHVTHAILESGSHACMWLLN